jgi:hypothetical protein
MTSVIQRGSIHLTAVALLVLAIGRPAGAEPGNDNRAPDLTGYEKLRVADGNKVAFAAYAEGVQIYRWNGTKWDFVEPEAVLYSGDHEGAGVVAVHYRGPTWESNSGSTVVGTVLERATPDPTAISWLKLGAVSSDGPGPFDGVTFIQRLYTVGGVAPAEPGDFVGEVARVPYSAWYYFYRARQ